MCCRPRAAHGADRAALRVAQGLRQQRVGLGAALVGRDVVRLVEIHRIDGRDRHELVDVRDLGARLFHRLELVRVEHDVLVLGEFIALDHLIARDRDVFPHAEVLLPQARAAVLVQQVEGNGALRFRGGVELHRDRDQPERNRQIADRTCSHG
jgi:hypothetical protein